MSAPPLRLNPAEELEWQLVVGRQLTNELTLFNTTSSHVAFKVKTTAPKQYCVRPNSGTIPPHSSQQVLVFLQPLKDTAGSEKWKDKFLVQSIVIGNEEPKKDDVKKIWETVDKEKKAGGPTTYTLTDQKLRCKFIIPTRVKTVPEESSDVSNAASVSSSSKFDSKNDHQSAGDVLNSSGSGAAWNVTQNSSLNSSRDGGNMTPVEKNAILEDRLRRSDLERQKLAELIEDYKKNLANKNEENRKLMQEFQEARRLVQNEAGLRFRGNGAAGSSGAANVSAADDGKSGAVDKSSLAVSGGMMDVKGLALMIFVAIIFFLVGRGGIAN